MGTGAIIILSTLLLQPSSASQDALAAWLRDVGERGPHRPADLVYETRPELSPVTSIWYSSSFAADPAFWRDTTRTGPNQWRATKLSEVQFPSQKAVLFANEAWRQSRRKIAPLGFMDASAEGVPEASLKGGYPSGTGDWPGSGLAGPVPGMVTIDGVHGRDR